MSFRTDMLGIVEGIRISVRGGLDQCPNKLTIIRRDWSGGKIGKGTPTETVLIDFPQVLPIRQMIDEEMPEVAGMYTNDDIMVSRITPWNKKTGSASRGYTPTQLRPTFTDNGHEVIYRVTGDGLNGDYTILDLRVGGRASHPGGYSGRGGVYSYALILRRRRDSPVNGP